MVLGESAAREGAYLDPLRMLFESDETDMEPQCYPEAPGRNRCHLNPMRAWDQTWNLNL